MQKLQFTIDINASAQKVYSAMLGLEDKRTYQLWTAAFNPTSTYEGTWDKGSKIYFIGTDENGKKGGMVSEIVAHEPAKFVSIRHYGFLDGDNEITTGQEVEKWEGGHENYSFMEQQELTTVTVDIDVIEEYLGYFQSTYPKALQLLKSSVEQV